MTIDQRYEDDAEHAKSDMQSYMRCLITGNTSGCVAIEKRWYLYGYPPEMVSSVLAKVAGGMSVDDAIGVVENGG